MLFGEIAAVTLMTLQTAPSASAPATQPPTVKIDLLDMAARKRGCKANKDDPGEVVVCGTREADRYRIDPGTLSVLRRNDPSNAHPDWRSRLAESKCSPVGQFGCMQGPAINFLAVAMMLARIAKGESIASIAKTSPDEYDAYRAANPADGESGE